MKKKDDDKPFRLFTIRAALDLKEEYETSDGFGAFTGYDPSKTDELISKFHEKLGITEVHIQIGKGLVEPSWRRINLWMSS